MATGDPFLRSPTLSDASFFSFASISSPSSLPPSTDNDAASSAFSPISNPPSVISLSSTPSSSSSNLTETSYHMRSNRAAGGSSSSFSILSAHRGGSAIRRGMADSPDLDPSTQLLIAQLTLADLVTHRATMKQKRPATSAPDDTELALQQQEADLRALVIALRDSALAKSIDRAVETDAELVRALEAMEVSERDDRRAAQVLEREGALPQATEAQRTVGRKGFGIPENGKDEDDQVIVGGSSFFNRRPTASTSRAKIQSSPKFECISCTEKFPQSNCVTAPCTHIYCHACVISLVEACMRDESLYPIKCCKQPFSIRVLSGILTLKLRLAFDDKCREFGTPADRRVYCCNPRCSEFLGPSSTDGEVDDIHCGACRTLTCTGCKQPSHPNDNCQENADAIRVREMATEEGWQTCPGCKAIVELNIGCYHMTCRCRTEFCYLCAARWKNCGCPQWDENLLVVDARRRVENEMGRGMQAVEPRLFANHVERRVQQLRTRHECIVHDWTNRSGGGECEQCGDYLPIYLKICRGCSMLVCRRCALNRL